MPIRYHNTSPVLVLLQISFHFPTTIRSLQILNAVTSEALDHQGTFRNPSDQIDYIGQTLKDSRYRRSGDGWFFFSWAFSEYS